MLAYGMSGCLMIILCWFQWRDASPDQLMDSKLKCVFEIPPELTPQTSSNVEVTSTTPHTAKPEPVTSAKIPMKVGQHGS